MNYFPSFTNKVEVVDGLGPDKVFPTQMHDRGEDTWILGRRGLNNLFLSKDGGDTWVQIGKFSGEIYATFITSCPDEEKSIIVCEGNKVWLSNGLELNTTEPAASGGGNFQLVLESSSGIFSRSMGWDVKQNQVFLSTYGSKTASNPPRHAYMSQDYGATWREIFDGYDYPENMVDPANYHIHDIAFDQYNNRIWLSIGDVVNGDLAYSDDYGENWHFVYGDQAGIIQPTCIIPLWDKIILGSDKYPDGIRVIYKSEIEGKRKITPDDIKTIYTPWTFDKPFRGQYAVKPGINTELIANEYPIKNLYIPFIAGEYSYVLGSPDGNEWHSILYERNLHAGQPSVFSLKAGPTQKHRKMYIRVTPSKSDQPTRLWVVDIPDWIKVK